MPHNDLTPWVGRAIIAAMVMAPLSALIGETLIKPHSVQVLEFDVQFEMEHEQHVNRMRKGDLCI